MAETSRAQLIHIDVDRRLGHEWDEWDGKPLPNQGNYDSAPALFFLWSAAALAVGLAAASLALFLLGPRLASLYGPLPRVLWIGLGLVADTETVAVPASAAPIVIREPRPIRPHFADPAELELHRAFIAQLSNPLWARFAEAG